MNRISAAALFLFVALNAAAAAPAVTAQPPKTEQSLRAAVAYLVERQSPDGAWRSDTYGTFKDGTGLTPLVLHALDKLPPTLRPARSCDRAAAFLAAMVRPDGTIAAPSYGFDYPIYTAALAVTVLSNPHYRTHRSARDAWLAYLRQRQLTEALGWAPADREYGGWGYCRTLSRKPSPGAFAASLIESNLSATRFALVALRAAGAPSDDRAFAAALVFVKRCQNLPADLAAADPAYDDGGFHFIYDDPVRNKAGVAGRDRHGSTRLASYGSTTADGLRCLLACGRPPTDARVAAAAGWLKSHFTPESHPGHYVERHESNRQAVYYYYAAALAGAFHAAGVEETVRGNGVENWSKRLAREIVSRQQGDGSWSNPAHAMREDDPVTATALALTALGAVSGK